MTGLLGYFACAIAVVEVAAMPRAATLARGSERRKTQQSSRQMVLRTPEFGQVSRFRTALRMSPMF
jgi:hypothetical protein